MRLGGACEKAQNARRVGRFTLGAAFARTAAAIDGNGFRCAAV
jgi:hypothetical protein